MSRPAQLITDLTPGVNVWKIAVRVIDLWIVKERNGNQHLEAILQDIKGNQIHLITRNRELDAWKNTLLENQTYMVYNGEPLINDLPLKVCDNNFKLFFNATTTITSIDMPEIPQHTFNFKPFGDFESGEFNVDRLYDVIGKLQQVVRTQVAGTGKKPCINFVLSDEFGTEIDVTLWEAYANQLMAFTNDNGMPVIILTHAWCRQSSTTGKLNLSNAWSGSKLLINFEHPQVVEFKNKFDAANPSPVASQTLTIQSGSQIPFDDKSFSFHNDIKSIGEMICLTEESYCNTIGMTKRFKANRYGWYYEVCRTCNKTNKSPGELWFCDCSKDNSAPVTKYKIEIEVEHDGKQGSFIFWDKECIPIVGLSAHDLRQIMKKTNEDHPLKYPSHLDDLLEKHFAFRVKYQPYYRQASIVKLTEDAEVRKMMEDFLAPTDHAANIPALSASIKGKEIVESQELIVPKALPASTNQTDTGSASAAQNWSPDNSLSHTPSKRMSEEDSNEETEPVGFLSPKQSATKNSRAKSARQSKAK